MWFFKKKKKKKVELKDKYGEWQHWWDCKGCKLYYRIRDNKVEGPCPKCGGEKFVRVVARECWPVNTEKKRWQFWKDNHTKSYLDVKKEETEGEKK